MAQLAWIWLVLVSVFQVAYSKETDRSHWTEPDGSKDGNFLTSYHPGDSIRVGWVGWDSSFTDRLMDKSSKANLYVNAWNSNYSSFVKIISSSQDISTNGHFEWEIEIDNTTLGETKQFGFTFIPVGKPYSIHGPRMYSPGINVTLPKESTTSDVTTSDVTTSTSSTSTSGSSSTTQTSSPTTTETASQATDSTTSDAASSDTGGLSPGAKAGVGVGVSAAGVAILAVVGFLIFRRRRQSASQQPRTPKFSELATGSTPATVNGYQNPNPRYPPGMSNSSPVELASTTDGK